MDEFESFTREKITRLRAEADALEKILKEFQGTKARQAGASRRSGGDQPRAGAFGVVMEAITGAGASGLSLDQMIQAAEAEGYEVKRPTLRAQVWKAKEDGQLAQMEPGRYRLAVHDAFANVVVEPPPARTADDDDGYTGGGFQRTPPHLMPKSPPAPPGTFETDLDDEIPF